MECLTELRKCKKCRIHKEARMPVYPNGSERNKGIMVIGQNPGKNEDDRGVPFIGLAGKYLDDFLFRCGVAREDCYVTNAIKCFTHKSSPPNDVEAFICSNLWLKYEVIELKPSVVILLGKFAAYAFLGYNPTPFEHYLGSIMGKSASSSSTKIVKYTAVLPHPSAVFRAHNVYQKYYDSIVPELKKLLEEVKNES
jgi:DNA polymerase